MWSLATIAGRKQSKKILVNYSIFQCCQFLTFYNIVRIWSKSEIWLKIWLEQDFGQIWKKDRFRMDLAKSRILARTGFESELWHTPRQTDPQVLNKQQDQQKCCTHKPCFIWYRTSTTGLSSSITTSNITHRTSSQQLPSLRNHHHHHTTTVLRPFFWDHPGEPVPEENFWTLWCKGRLTEADTSTIRLGDTPYRLTSAHLNHPLYFLQTGCPSCHPTNSVKALKATNTFGLGSRR